MREHNYMTTSTLDRAKESDGALRVMRRGIADMFGHWTDVPPGLEHRLLDMASVESLDDRVQSAFLYRAHHFSLGVEASQALLYLAADPTWLEDYGHFAPHPFPDYTVSFWIGHPKGIAEMYTMVATRPNGEVYADSILMRWGSDEPVGYTHQHPPVQRDSMPLADMPPHQTLTWMMNDAFRLLLAKPGGVTINKGGPNRHALRKGKRVTFYSKSEITIDLDKALRDKVLVNTGLGKMMPVYQYRAHLCHSGGSRHCEHEFERDYERNNPYWTCTKCGRNRWHRKAGTRGSAEIGYVRQTYKVKKGSDK